MIIYMCSICRKEFENTKEYLKHVCKGLPDSNDNSKKKNKQHQYSWGESTELGNTNND